MPRYLKLIAKNVKQNKLRTTLTMLGIVMAVFIFCFFQSVQIGMKNVTAEAAKLNNLVVVQQGVS